MRFDGRTRRHHSLRAAFDDDPPPGSDLCRERVQRLPQLFGSGSGFTWQSDAGQPTRLHLRRQKQVDAGQDVLHYVVLTRPYSFDIKQFGTAQHM